MKPDKPDRAEQYAEDQCLVVELMLAPTLLVTTKIRDVIFKELEKAWRAGHAAGVAEAGRIESIPEEDGYSG